MQFHGRSQGVHVHIAIQATAILLGMAVLTSYLGLDLHALS